MSGSDPGLKFGFLAEARDRVLVWRIPDEGDWDVAALSEYEGEIRKYLPDFSFQDADSDSVWYSFKGGGVFQVDRGCYLVLSLESLRLRRSSAKYIMSRLHGVGL
jgi:hypothetical protein